MKDVLQPLKVGFWNVGQGDASSIHWPDGSVTFIDLGPRNQSQILQWLELMPNMHRPIRDIILTHCDNDHIGDILEIITSHHQRITGKVWLVDDRNHVSTYLKKFSQKLNQLQRKGILDFDQITPGPNDNDQVEFWTSQPGVKLFSVHPYRRTFIKKKTNVRPNPNHFSAVISLEIEGNVQIIWGGDAKQETVSEACNGLKPLLLMGPHHGGPQDKDKKNYRDYFISPDPEYVWISAGTSNQHSHPYRSKFLPHHLRKGRKVVCSCLVHCDKKRVEDMKRGGRPGHITQVDNSIGLLCPTSQKQISCRGAMMLTWNGSKFEFDRGHQDHQEKLKAGVVLNPLCLQG